MCTPVIGRQLCLFNDWDRGAEVIEMCQAALTVLWFGYSETCVNLVFTEDIELANLEAVFSPLYGRGAARSVALEVST